MPSPNFYGNKRKFARTVSPDAMGDDTVKLIVETINTYSKSPFVKKTVDIINRDNPTKEEFMKRLFGIACKNVKYLADEPGHEIIYTPALLMRMGKGDCKKFTVFIASVMKAAGYDAVPKVVKYKPFKDWEHIYVISRDGNRYTTLDPVNHCRYNSEVRYSKGRLNFLDGTYSKIMDGNKLSLMGNLGDENNLNFLSGINSTVNKSASSFLDTLQSTAGMGDSNRSFFDSEGLKGLEEDYMRGITDINQIHGDEDESGVSGIGRKKAAAKGKKAPKARTKKTKEEKRAKRKALFQKAKKFSPAMASVRIAFLSLVKMGGALQKIKGIKINLAKKLAEAMQNPERAKPVLDIWFKFGGDKNSLMKAIAQAGKSKMHGMGASEIILEGMEGIGVAPAVAAAAVITAATPILIPIIKMFQKKGQVSPEAAEAMEETVEAAEEIATSPKGGLTETAVKVLRNSKLVKSAMEDDAGGNQATVKEIEAEAQQESANFPKGKAKSSEPLPQETKSYTEVQEEKEQEPDARTAEPNSNLPVKLQDTPQAQGKATFGSIYDSRTWLKTLLIISVLFSQSALHSVPGKALTSVVFCITIIMFVKFLINQNRLSNGKKGKS